MSGQKHNDLGIEIDPEMEARAKKREAMRANERHEGSAIAASAKGVGAFGTLGMEIVVSVLLGLFGGQWLDKRFNTGPLLTIAGVTLAGITIVKAILRVMRDMKRETLKEEAREGNPAPLWETPSEQKEREREQKETGDRKEENDRGKGERDA